MAYKEPKKVTSTATIGNLSATFEGEHFTGLGILDTNVTIAGKSLCCIIWSDKENFIAEINDVILKHRI